MKKLLIALTAVAGLVGLARAELAPGSLREEGFEGTAIPTTGWAKLDANDGSQITPWQQGEAPEVSEYPGAFLSFGNKYLGVSNADPLLALFGTMGATDPTPVDIGTGLFVDTYVKFSATETAPTPSNGVDKVIVWMYGSDTDSTTNLIVTAGHYVEGTPSPCHYAVDAVVEPDTWHRLTIKAMSVSETVATKIGFRVYIDGTEVAIKGKLVNGVVNEEDKSVGDSIYQGDVTEDLASEKLGQNRLFPSLIAAHSTLSCVGLEGWGAVDNFVLTTDDPFPDLENEAEFTFTWEPLKFKDISYQVGTAQPVVIGSDDFQSGSAALTLSPGAAVTFTCTPADGYMLGAFTAGGQCSVSGTTFTMNNPLRSSTASGELVVNEVVATIGTTKYASLKDALAAVLPSVPAKITIAKNLILNNEGGTSWNAERLTIAAGQNVTIDLDGRTITVVDGTGASNARPLFEIAETASLTIEDGSEAQTGAVISATAPIALNSGTLNISGGKFTGLISNNGDAENPTIALTGGSFSGEEGSFYLASVLEGTQYEANYAEGYWTVSEKVASDFIVTAAPVENTTLKVTVDDEEVTVGGNNTYTIPAGKTAIVTYTAAEHYTITANAVQEFTAEGTAVAPTLHAWLKYAADLYLCGSTTTNKLEVQAQLGTDDHYYDIGTQVAAQYAGVMTDPEFISEKGTYYISKIVDLESETFVEFTYDGTTYAKVDGALEVTLGAGNVLSYTVTTGTKATFAQVYFTKYEPPAPVGPLKYAADLYLCGSTTTNKLEVQAQLGTGDHYYDIGTQVAAQYAGVVTDPTFIGAGTYYISKIVDLENDKTVEFTYDGTTYAKVEADGALEVTLGAGNVLSYTVTTGTKETFAEVYFTKYEPPAPEFPSVDEGDPITTPADFIAAAKSGTTIELPKDWTIDGTAIKNAKGEVWATLPAYYNISTEGAVSLNESVVKPTISDGDDGHKAIEIGTSGVSINVAKPCEGLWYVLMRAETVGGTYEPVKWVQATGENIQLEDDTKLEDGKIPGKGFYKVKVTDVKPEGQTE